MTISFPFTFIGKTSLGKIYRPYAIVSVFSKLGRKYIPIEMVIDTGADYTLLPRKYAEILGVDLKTDCRSEQTLGVGGRGKVYQYSKLPIKIGDWSEKIPMGFLNRDDVPALLGRLNCLEIFKLSFGDFVTIIKR